MGYVQYAVEKTCLWKVEGQKIGAIWEDSNTNLTEVQESEKNKEVFMCFCL